jgi:hypothetical protein
MLDQETQQYYDKYFTMFSSEGWKQLIQELTANAVNINSVEATKDPEDLSFRKGQLNVLGFLVNLESTTEANYEEASNDAESV